MEISIKNINAQHLQLFIKKLLSIDKFIFIKINDKAISSAVYLPQRDAVKLVAIKVSDIFEVDSLPDSTIKLAFFNGNRVIDALGYFDAKEPIQGIIKYKKIGDEYFASDFVVFNKKITINLPCVDPALSFMDMSKDEIKRAFSTENAQFEFSLSPKNIDDISSFFKLDRDYDRFKFVVDSGTLKVKGENYESSVIDGVDIKDGNITSVTMYKKYLSLFDKENYSITVCSNKLFLKSKDSNTLMSVALCIGDDNDTPVQHEDDIRIEEEMDMPDL